MLCLLISLSSCRLSLVLFKDTKFQYKEDLAPSKHRYPMPLAKPKNIYVKYTYAMLLRNQVLNLIHISEIFQHYTPDS